MALADTGRAIGAVTRMLHDHLVAAPGVTAADVTVGKPEPPPGAPAASRLNLFLYEVQVDPHLRNISLDTGQVPPIWLVLKYLLTAFDRGGESDTAAAHDLLGEGVRALQEMAYLSLNGLTPTTLAALVDNPERLKITFDSGNPDLLSKLMQGSDEKYRLSMPFEVRPVLVATAEPPSYNLLVGVDYTPPGTIIGEAGIQIPVIPTMGPLLSEVDPPQFEPGETITIRGQDLHLAGLTVQLGPVTLGVTSQRPDRLECLVNGTIPGGTVISAGDHILTARMPLPNGKARASNAIVGGLMPRLTAATPVVINHVGTEVFGTIDLQGILLGTDSDDVYVALYRNGATVQIYDTFIPIPPPPPPPPIIPQTLRRLQIPTGKRVEQ